MKSIQATNIKETTGVTRTLSAIKAVSRLAQVAILPPKCLANKLQQATECHSCILGGTGLKKKTLVLLESIAQM